MAKPTLLEIVQSILNDINGDEVNSISDTEESEQVAEHVKHAYRAIVSRTEWPHTRRAVALNPRSDANYPTHMTVKEELKELISVRYNNAKDGETRRNYEDVLWCPPDEFLRRINRRDNTATNVDIVIDDSGIELLIKNDKGPEWFTSFDDVNLVFDSFDSAVDNSLQQSKLQAQGYIIPAFTVADNFVPDLPADAFAFLIEDSVSRVQYKMREFRDMKAEMETTKQSRRMSRKAWTSGGGIGYRDYGRNKSGRVQGIQPWPKG